MEEKETNTRAGNTVNQTLVAQLVLPSGFESHLPGTCSCDEGWIGGACFQMECPDLCHHNGVCVVGECVCHSGYIGTSCETMECPHGCSGHGTCMARNYTLPATGSTDSVVVRDGVECKCQLGWGGDDFDCRVNVQCKLGVGVWAAVVFGFFSLSVCIISCVFFFALFFFLSLSFS